MKAPRHGSQPIVVLPCAFSSVTSFCNLARSSACLSPLPSASPSSAGRGWIGIMFCGQACGPCTQTPSRFGQVELEWSGTCQLCPAPDSRLKSCPNEQNHFGPGLQLWVPGPNHGIETLRVRAHPRLPSTGGNLTNIVKGAPKWSL